MVSTPQMLVAWGRTTSNDPVGVIVGLDPQTGNQRYAVAQDSHWSDGVSDIGLEFNGRYVIAVWGFGLHAYDPSNGERRWHIGGR